MDGRTHKCIGLCSGIVATEIMISSNVSTENIVLGGMLISGSILGSILLDIDKKGTKISKKVPLLSGIICSFTSHRGLTHWFPLWILIGGLLMRWLNIMSNQTMLIATTIYSFCAVIYFISEIMKKLRKPFKKKKKFIKYILASVFGAIITYLIYTGGTTFMNVFLFCVLTGLLVGIGSHLFLDALTPAGIPLLGKKRIHLAYLDEKVAGPIICVIGWIVVFFSTGVWFILK